MLTTSAAAKSQANGSFIVENFIVCFNARAMTLKGRLIICGTFALSALVWALISMHWYAILDGDAALYSLMSLDVLGGHHHLYTVGQSHGGTPLVYLRAALFALFGPSHFW